MTPAETPASTVSVKAAALVELLVGLDQFALLALHLAGHAIESPAQRGEFLIALAFLGPRREIARADAFGDCRSSR